MNDSLKSTSVKSGSKYGIEKKTTFLSVYYGVSNYLGDLGGNSGNGKGFIHDVNFKKKTSFIGFSISRVYKEAVGVRLGYTAGNIAGSDQDAAYKNETDPAYKRYKRNLDFQSKITEWSLLIEAYPLKFISRTNNISRWQLQPYVMCGVGRYKFNPQGSYYDPLSRESTWVDLQPLSTEGQGMKEYPDRKPYKRSQFNLPYGLGVRYSSSAKTSISFEYVGRKLFTDYLDDVSTNYIDPSLYANYFDKENADIAKAMSNKSSQIDPNNPYVEGNKRGNSKKNDFYYSFNLKLSIQMNKQKRKAIALPEVSPWQGYKYDNGELCY